MTRISGYELLACPYCGKIHRKTSYSSINLQVNPDFFERMNALRKCFACQKDLQLNEMISLGFKEFEPKVQYFLGNNPYENNSILKKITLFFLGAKVKIEKPTKEVPEWMKYPVV